MSGEKSMFAWEIDIPVYLETRMNEKSSTRRPFLSRTVMGTSLRPLKRKSNAQKTRRGMQNKHNHAFALDTASYPIHRRLEGEAQENVINMIKAHAENSTIITYLKRLGITVVSKDTSNLRQKVFNNDLDHGMFRLIQALQVDGYQARYNTKKFPEIISLDATYKTNKRKKLFINVVGTGNAGFPKLKTFCIAGIWIAEETSETCEWVVNALMEVVWSSEQSLSPAAFVTDSEAALMRALDVPVVKRENKQVNLARIDLVF
ncbi:hypothetical protein VTP01DRAFT_8076 [Rhizomucor pusillus]|uniref:uncharacterized protein n=1 Tax=Rhizomucor pusillus TaxID=4840 RepID=UPI0037446A0E